MADIGFFGINFTGMLYTIFEFAFYAVLIIGFVLYKDKNPYMPRKYYKVNLVSEEGKDRGQKKGWAMKDKKIDYFRVQIKGMPSFKGVQLDIGVMDAIDENGILTLVEHVPDLIDPSNYRPKQPPLTQREKFLEDEKANIQAAIVSSLQSPDILVKVKDEAGNESVAINNSRLNENLNTALLRTKDSLNKNSRMEDINKSGWVRARVSQRRQEEDRTQGGDFIQKYGATISLIVIFLFAYLVIDNGFKTSQAQTQQMNAVAEQGYAQVVAACGGQFRTSIPAQNATQQQPSGGFKIPFLGG